jgi:hypothetical protein
MPVSNPTPFSVATIFEQAFQASPTDRAIAGQKTNIPIILDYKS